MKMYNLIIATLLACACSLNAFAQKKETGTPPDQTTAAPPPRDAWMADLNLTAEQKEKMKNIHMNTAKEVKPLRSQVGEKEAHLKTLTVADKPDMMEINKTLDEISTLKNKMAKLQMAAKMEIRGLLTEEQRTKYDEHEEMRGKDKKGPHGKKMDDPSDD